MIRPPRQNLHHLLHLYKCTPIPEFNMAAKAAEDCLTSRSTHTVITKGEKDKKMAFY